MDSHVLSAQLSALAYPIKGESPNEFEKRMRATIKSMGFPDVVFFDRGESQAIAASNDKEVWVVFRGTESGQDFVSDLACIPTPGPFSRGKVHGGFQAYLNQISHQIFDVIEDMGADRKEIHVCGHSLGAAAAQLFAAQLSEYEDKSKPFYERNIYRNQIKSVIVFGCPLVGNREWAAIYNSRLGKITHRYMNNNDAVSFLTWAVLKRYGFRPAGDHLHYFDADGNHHYKPSHLFILKEKLRGYWQAGIGDGLRDHSSLGYMRLTKAARA